MMNIAQHWKNLYYIWHILMFVMNYIPRTTIFQLTYSIPPARQQMFHFKQKPTWTTTPPPNSTCPPPLDSVEAKIAPPLAIVVRARSVSWIRPVLTSIKTCTTWWNCKMILIFSPRRLRVVSVVWEKDKKCPSYPLPFPFRDWWKAYLYRCTLGRWNPLAARSGVRCYSFFWLFNIFLLYFVLLGTFFPGILFSEWYFFTLFTMDSFCAASSASLRTAV